MLSRAELARMAEMDLDRLAQDCTATAFHAHGPGGQGVNTADSAVRMRHIPTGIVVVSRESRSQFRNRQICLQKIREELKEASKPPSIRHPTGPTKSSTYRRLAEKHARSQVKQARRRVVEEE